MMTPTEMLRAAQARRNNRPITGAVVEHTSSTHRPATPDAVAFLLVKGSPYWPAVWAVGPTVEAAREAAEDWKRSIDVT